MNIRKVIIVLISIGLVVGAVFAAKLIAGSKKKNKPKEEKSITTAFVVEVENSVVDINVVESGRLLAKNRMQVFAEVQGIMQSTSKVFKPGTKYSKGDVLVSIYKKDFEAQVLAQKSGFQSLIASIIPDLRLDYPEAYEKWNHYLKDFDINKSLADLPKTSSDQEEYFIAGRNIYTTFYTVKNLEIRLKLYTISAPFSGVLSQANVTPGTLVRPGQKLGEFIDPGVYELEVSVSKSLLPSLKVGKEVRIVDEDGTGEEYQGEIARINSVVDPNNQTIQIYIDVKGDNLKEGMYLRAFMSGEQKENAFEFARTLLVDESKVFVANNSKLELKDVNILHKTQNTVVVSGLEDGTKLISKPIPSAYTGMEISIYEGE